MKQILHVLREKNVRAARSTIWYWRWRLPPAMKPPIRMCIDGNRPCVTADRKKLLRWVDRMEKYGLFEHSRKVMATNQARRALESGKAAPAASIRTTFETSSRGVSAPQR